MENESFFKNYFPKNYLIFLCLVATLKWIGKLSLFYFRKVGKLFLNFSCLASHENEIELFFKKNLVENNFISHQAFFFFSFYQSFNLWRPLMIIALLLSNQNTSFWYWQKLNLRYLIQPSEILSVKLTRTHLSHTKLNIGS